MRFVLCVLLAAVFPVLIGFADENTKWLVTLTDESRVFIEPVSSNLELNSEPLGGGVSIAVAAVEEVEKAGNGDLRVALTNGDLISGRVEGGSIVGESLLGRIKIPVQRVQHIQAQKRPGGGVDENAGRDDERVLYGDFRWDVWRTGWEITADDRLASQRCVRPGFPYGHWANGRGGMVVTGNGDQDWTDYEVAFDYKMLAANREFFHAHIPGETRGLKLYFRSKSLTESWNEPDTAYGLAINPHGSWTLVAYEGWFMPGHGWSSTNRQGSYKILANGKAESDADFGEGRIRIRVEDYTFQAWLNDESLFEFTHEGGEIERIPFGGFGVQWRYESMGWIGNLAVERLD